MVLNFASMKSLLVRHTLDSEFCRAPWSAVNRIEPQIDDVIIEVNVSKMGVTRFRRNSTLSKISLLNAIF